MFFCGMVHLMPSIWFREFHMQHHRHTQDTKKDPELGTEHPKTIGSYIFLITGRLMLGRWKELLGFDEFAQRLEKILSIGGGGVTAAWDITIAMVALWGIPLFIGCIPWAIISGLIGYYWTLRYKEGRRRRRSSVA